MNNKNEYLTRVESKSGTCDCIMGDWTEEVEGDGDVTDIRGTSPSVMKPCAMNSMSLVGSMCVNTMRSWTLRDFSWTSADSSPRVTLSCHDREENKLLPLLSLSSSSSSSSSSASSVSLPCSPPMRNCGSGSRSSSSVPPAAARASSKLRRAAETVPSKQQNHCIID